MAKRVKTGGRQKGTPNKATAEIKSLAQAHGEEAISTLVELLRSDNPMVRVSACRELLDRGYGKARQSHELTGEDGTPLTVMIVDPTRRHVTS